MEEAGVAPDTITKQQDSEFITRPRLARETLQAEAYAVW